MTETAQVSKFKPHSQAPPPNTSLGMSSLFLHFEMEVGMRLSKSQLSLKKPKSVGKQVL